MSFIRPEARETLWQWREVLAAALMFLLGLKWAYSAAGFTAITGWALVATGLVAAVIGVQRMRFRRGSGGPGVVQVDEGQIAYFGPLNGGAVAASELERLALDHTSKPPHWLLEQPGQPPLAIPVNAEGYEALFDVFAALPGLKTERMLAELRRRGPHQVVIWERAASRPEHQRLH
ncbi:MULTISPECIES: hypothetical protein [unclassified Leisingera]|uniref:hypothetical protein n=1 Tax=unclassified Leisingera TaxID=2614906 RepID=UPI0002FF339E|nr:MULTISPECIES: hypothetical protein [unclassified Leisingera]KIC16476.1 hypothetical protein RA21_12610 [Leisingera sp. ANG-DT]KIC24633.1 hypothetical protein RA23_08740 [Leisingera sp. ANG-S3]KIC28585.1 hypothetical protein RA24_11815 [Leisingera sp. ANG-M6]KIC31712.1 hypothetical protein RA25_16575 [Leisingera sp. ANG-S5]KIC55511.1 hypothetical protein RA22_01870 [Leisingera sp. ANG-S]